MNILNELKDAFPFLWHDRFSILSRIAKVIRAIVYITKEPLIEGAFFNKNEDPELYEKWIKGIWVDGYGNEVNIDEICGSKVSVNFGQEPFTYPLSGSLEPWTRKTEHLPRIYFDNFQDKSRLDLIREIARANRELKRRIG